MRRSKLASVVVLVAFLGVIVSPVSANEGGDALLIVGPALLGVALLVTLVAVIGTRSTDKARRNTPGRASEAAPLEPQAPPTPGGLPAALASVPPRADTPDVPRAATGFAMLCPQRTGGIAVACW